MCIRDSVKASQMDSGDFNLCLGQQLGDLIEDLRQQLIFSTDVIQGALQVFFGGHRLIAQAVSYTHLDVYKRQSLDTVRISVG